MILSLFHLLHSFKYLVVYSVTIQPQRLAIHDLLHSLTFLYLSPTLCLADSKLPIIYA